MPSPRSDESREDFLSRCMGDPEANRSFPESDQRYVFCNSQWDNRNKSTNMKEKKIIIPSDLRGKDLFSFLIENKDAIIAQRKLMPKFSDAIAVPVSFVNKEGKLIEMGTKADNGSFIPPDQTSVEVSVVGNAMWWCDSQMDVLTIDSAKRTIQQRKSSVVHLKDHIHQLEAQIGDVQDVRLEDVALRKLGLDKSGSTQCIVMDSVVQKSYNPRIFDMYSQGKVKQHSIGMFYVQLELAINDPEWEKEMDFWNKYYEKIINKEVPDEWGFFWVVNEIRLMEISAVLFGSNELTPTLRIGKGHSLEPAHEAPLDDSTKTDEFDVDVAILTTKFF